MRHNRMRLILLCACFLGSGCSTVNRAVAPASPPATTTADSIRAHETAAAFLVAFDSLRWDEFRQYFADDATVFFPFSDVASRVSGRVEIESVFLRFFDQVRSAWETQRQPGSPRLGLQPRDMQIQMMSDAAIVTFQLGTEQAPSRRTLVLRRSPEGPWKIVHLHASPAPARRGS